MDAGIEIGHPPVFVGQRINKPTILEPPQLNERDGSGMPFPVVILAEMRSDLVYKLYRPIGPNKRQLLQVGHRHEFGQVFLPAW
jgi:hypothetical protein